MPASTKPFTNGHGRWAAQWAALLKPVAVGRSLRVVGLELRDNLARGVVLERRKERPALVSFFERTWSGERVAAMASAAVVASLPMRDAPVVFADDGADDQARIADAIRSHEDAGTPVDAVLIGDARILAVLPARARTAALASALARKELRYRITSELFAIEALVRAATDVMPCLALHVGQKTSLIQLLNERECFYAREIQIGDDDLVEALTRPFTTAEGQRVVLAPDEARHVRREFVYGTEGLLKTSAQVRFSSSVLFALMRPLFERLLAEARKATKRYVDTSGAPRCMVLSGEGAEIHGINRYFASELSIDVIVANPLLSVQLCVPAAEQVAFANVRHRFGVAMGLALDPRTEIDLTPARVRLRRPLLVLKWSLRSVALLLAFLLVLKARQLGVQASLLEQSRASLERAVAELAPLAGRALAAAEEERGLDRDRRLWQSRAIPSFLPWLVDLVNALPPDVYFDQVLVQAAPPRLELSGRIVPTAGQRADQAGLYLARDLEQSTQLLRHAFEVKPASDGWLEFSATLRGGEEPQTTEHRR